MFVNGQGKRLLASTVVNVASGGTFPTSVDFGTFLVSEFAGIGGMVKCDSSFGASPQLRYQMTSGGAIVVSSAIAVSSGITVNELNPSAYVDISVIGISSASPVRVYLTGLPIR